ncbi:hypothetical protein Scep_026458 [Stephania cephalantha]|uniref:Uncharacterized protein n=1 Tax=Stephania cephalantha TaxID=152367 RepID=A0AAP0EU21_9MAGN
MSPSVTSRLVNSIKFVTDATPSGDTATPSDSNEKPPPPTLEEDETRSTKKVRNREDSDQCCGG